MAIRRYFLMPLEQTKDPHQMEKYVGPKYEAEVDAARTGGVAQGVISKETSTVGPDRTFLRRYYVIMIDAASESDFSDLRSKSDVIEVSPDKIKDNSSRLTTAGIDLSGLDGNSPAEDYERRLFSWLLDEQGRTLADLFVVAPTS